jgi:hypothetical protein
MANRADFSDWESLDLSNIIRNLGQVGLTEVLGAMVEEGEQIMAQSKARVPVRDGILRASADEVGVNVTQDATHGEVAFGYGGAASAYSIVQHETPPPGGDPDPDYQTDRRFTHAEGQTWKYLEAPVLEAAEGMEERLASRIDIRKEGIV